MTALTALEGGDPAAVLLWEARMERRVGEVIRAHVREHPCPGPSVVSDDLLTWSGGLIGDAEDREVRAVTVTTSRRRTLRLVHSEQGA
jgi:hypothetical protein